MRVNLALASAFLSSALLAGSAYANSEEPVAAPEAVPEAASEVEPEAEPESSSSLSHAEKPTFTPTNLEAPFLEQFTSDWETRWTPSHAKKEDSKTDEEWAYVGEWAVEEPTVLLGMVGDQGLVVKNEAAHHAISAKFPKTIDNTGKTLVLQYEVKLQNGLECGGAYMKLLRVTEALQSEEFSNASPYVIMFGPDKCGATNKVHFIFNHKNPKTGEYEEKHMKSPPSAKTAKLSTLYTLIVKPDNTFEMLIDNVSSKNGSLLEDFSPSVNPEKEINDPDDTKPEDWVDQVRIPDPDATKPDDWDEDEPFEVVDTDAAKPDDWLDDEPKTVPDPEAEKPDDWIDDEDGDWIAPSIPNPKCNEASGCGEWKPPMKRNPNFKGKWSAPQIDNPDYKGPWAPRKIPNPAHFEDTTPANFEPIGAIGFEIWTMQKDILFDNIFIGHSVDDAAALRKETWDVKRPVEAAEEAASRPKLEEKAKSPMDLSFVDDPLKYVKDKLDLFVTLAKRDPMEAVRIMPEVAGAIGMSVVALLTLVVGLVGIGGSSAGPSKEKIKAATDQAKEKVIEKKGQAAETVSSGVETTPAEVSKRTTRSSAAAE